MRAVATGNTDTARRAALAIAHAVLDGAKDRGAGPFIPSLLDQQRRDAPMDRLRERRPGRTSQALAARSRGGR